MFYRSLYSAKSDMTYDRYRTVSHFRCPPRQTRLRFDIQTSSGLAILFLLEARLFLKSEQWGRRRALPWWHTQEKWDECGRHQVEHLTAEDSPGTERRGTRTNKEKRRAEQFLVATGYHGHARLASRYTEPDPAASCDANNPRWQRGYLYSQLDARRWARQTAFKQCPLLSTGPLMNRRKRDRKKSKCCKKQRSRVGQKFNFKSTYSDFYCARWLCLLLPLFIHVFLISFSTLLSPDTARLQWQ